jgi:hypothetical protein
MKVPYTALKICNAKKRDGSVDLWIKITHDWSTFIKIKELETIFRAEIESLSHAASSFPKRGLDFHVTAVERDDVAVEGGRYQAWRETDVRAYWS